MRQVQIQVDFNRKGRQKWCRYGGCESVQRSGFSVQGAWDYQSVPGGVLGPFTGGLCGGWGELKAPVCHESPLVNLDKTNHLSQKAGFLAIHGLEFQLYLLRQEIEDVIEEMDGQIPFSKEHRPIGPKEEQDWATT